MVHIPWEDGISTVPSSLILYSIVFKDPPAPVLGELGLKPIPHELVGAGLLQGTGLDYLKLGQQLVGVLEHTYVLLHVGVGQILVSTLAGVLLNGLGHHPGAGEVLAAALRSGKLHM